MVVGADEPTLSVKNAYTIVLSIFKGVPSDTLMMVLFSLMIPNFKLSLKEFRALIWEVSDTLIISVLCMDDVTFFLGIQSVFSFEAQIQFDSSRCVAESAISFSNLYRHS